MSITRIYVVVQKGASTEQRLVEATSAAAAIRYCAQNVYAAQAAGPKDVAALMASGKQIEQANEQQTNQTGAN